MESKSGMSANRPQTLPAAFFRTWRHSREEDSDNVEVYRPEGFSFPPAFGRDGFEVRTDGTFIQHDIGPADGIVRVPGHWELQETNRIVVSFPGTVREGFVFEVESVDETVLRIQRVARQPGAVPTPYGSSKAMDEAQLQAFQALPPAGSHRRIDFDQARVVTLESFPPQFVLQVDGIKPYRNMAVELIPFIYVRQPEYWEIEVVGSLRAVGVPGSTAFSASLLLTGTIGSRGIEVVGATRRERIDVPPGEGEQGDCREWQAFLDRQPPGPPTLHVTGVCEFPTAGFSVELRRREPQGFNPRDLLLDKIVHAPEGVVAEVITAVDVRYSEQTEIDLETVTILPDGISIPVEVVH